MRQSIRNKQRPAKETRRTSVLIYFVFPKVTHIIRPSAEDPYPFANTVHFANGKIRSLNESLQNVDIMEYKTLQFHCDFAEGSKCQVSLFVFLIYLSSNRHFAQTKEKELDIVENEVNETYDG